MKLLHSSLIYDISNLAYVIADTGDTLNHGLHRVTDICQAGNRDRVARVLGHAYVHILDALAAVVEKPRLDINHDWSAHLRDYEFKFRKDCSLSPHKKLRIKECAREYMVSMVLADWLSITYPEAADIWQQKAREALDGFSVIIDCFPPFSRKISPL